MNSITPPSRRMHPAVKVIGALLIVVLILAGIWWWLTRPIQPVNLISAEKATVEAKLVAIQKPEEPTYEKGSRDIVLTERELNGLLNEKTSLGQSVHFELVSHAIHARIETDLDPDLPILGGRHFTARARFLVSEVPNQPSFILDDLTVWGISLPNDWLAGVKGRDLLGQIFGVNQRGKIPGVESFSVERGRLVIRLAE